MTACEQLLQRCAPHGPVKIAFTPDEEVGEGADHFRRAGSGRLDAYTMDWRRGRDILRKVQRRVRCVPHHGRSGTPGSAKDTIVNALKLACEIDGMLWPRGGAWAHRGPGGFPHGRSVRRHGCPRVWNISCLTTMTGKSLRRARPAARRGKRP